MSSEAAPSSLPRRGAPIRLIAVGVLAAALAAGFFAMQSRKGAAEAPAAAGARRPPAVAGPVEVRAENVAAASLSAPIRVTGTLRTDETVTLSTKATGLV